MATMVTNHVSVAMGQVATTSLPRYSHCFFSTTLFLVRVILLNFRTKLGHTNKLEIRWLSLKFLPLTILSEDH